MRGVMCCVSLCNGFDGQDQMTALLNTFADKIRESVPGAHYTVQDAMTYVERAVHDWQPQFKARHDLR